MTSIQYFRLYTRYNFISSKKTMNIMRFMLLILSKENENLMKNSESIV